jgi:hypothetical protein
LSHAFGVGPNGHAQSVKIEVKLAKHALDTSLIVLKRLELKHIADKRLPSQKIRRIQSFRQKSEPRAGLRVEVRGPEDLDCAAIHLAEVEQAF